MRLWDRGGWLISLAGAWLVAAPVLAGCGASGSGPENADKNSASVPEAVAAAKANNTAINPAIVAADNAFGLSALRLLQSQKGATNIAISPLSLSLALQILYNGAAGETRQAMTHTLRLGPLRTQQLNEGNAALQASSAQTLRWS